MTTGRVRRVLNSGDPRGDDFRAAEVRVKDIRSRLGHLRSELEDLGRIEAMFPHDRLCDDVAGALSLAIIALYRLVDGERSFRERAARTDERWANAAADPDAYVIRDEATWEWRPRGILRDPREAENSQTPFQSRQQPGKEVKCQHR